MERKNIYDMTNVSGKSISDAKRIQSQTATFLENYDAQLKESMQAEEDARMNAAMSGARFGYAANAARSAQRIHKMNEEIRYTQTSSVIGMTEMVAQVVENALLLDESELVKIYPEYKKDIRSMVKGFLEEGDINSTITNKETLALMEYVANKLPSVREGVSLTEDDLSNYIAANTPHDITRSIKNLGGDVATRVATLMEKEQKKAEKIDKDVKRAQAKAAKEETEITAEDLIHALEGGQLTEKELNKMLKDGEIDQNTYDEVIETYEAAANGEIEGEDQEMDPNAQGGMPEEGMEDPNAMGAEGQTPVTTSAEAPAEEDPNAAGMDPAMAGQDPAAMGMDPNAQGGMEDPNAAGMDPAMGGASAGVAPGSPKKQIQMLPDGTMNINIYESLLEASADQVRSNSKIANLVRDYLRKYGVKMTWRINKHIEACERLFNGNPDDIKLAMVAMPLVPDYYYGGYTTEGTRIILFTDDKIMVYGKGVLTGGKARTYQFETINDVIINEGMVWATVQINYKQKQNALESSFTMGRIHKNATKALEAFFRSHSNAKFQRVFDKDVDNTELKEDFEFVRETPRCGLIESLAVNEATTMLSEGQEYNADLALSKAIMYVTITEAMDELGLMDADEKKYAHIISAAGGKLLEYTDRHIPGIPVRPDGPTEKPEPPKRPGPKTPWDEEPKTPWNPKKPGLIRESTICSQYTPVRNDISNGDSLAERIRQKRLNEQKDILHD